MRVDPSIDKARIANNNGLMYLLFDIGGSHIRLAASHDGKIVGAPVIFDTPAADFEAGIALIAKTARQLTGGAPIRAAAGGIAGPLDTEKNMVLTAPNIPGWNRQPLKNRLEKALTAPVFLENDTAMIGLGEALKGAGSGKDIMVYLTISTGVGGCRIVRGKISPSALGFEPGHQIIDANGPKCGCGGRGHLEALVSGSALERLHNRKPEDITDGAIWEKAAGDLAAGLNNVLVFWSPDIIILGGSLMKSIQIELVRKNLKAIVTIFESTPPVEPSKLGEEAGLVGALEYIRQQMK